MEGHSILARGPLDYPPLDEPKNKQNTLEKNMLDFAVSLPEYKGLQSPDKRQKSIVASADPSDSWQGDTMNRQSAVSEDLQALFGKMQKTNLERAQQYDTR